MQGKEAVHHVDEFPYGASNMYTYREDGPFPFKHFIGDAPIHTLELPQHPQRHRVTQRWIAWCPTVCGHKLIAYGSNEQHAVNVLVRQWYITLRGLHEGRIATEQLITGEKHYGALTLWLHEDGTVTAGPFKPLSLKAQAIMQDLEDMRQRAQDRAIMQRALTELSVATSTSDLWEGEEWRFQFE
jgi:hypothetical protein